MPDKPTEIPYARGVTLETVASKPKLSALWFKVDVPPGQIGVCLPNKHLSDTAALLISKAGKVAAKSAPNNLPEEMTATPIMVSTIGLAQGRSDTEALLTFRVGNLDLSFAVEVATLSELCRNLQSMTVGTEPKRPQ